MSTIPDLGRLVASLQGLLIASDVLEQDAPSPQEISQVVMSGLFRPNENERFAYWLARFLTIRASIWELIDEAVAASDPVTSSLSTKQQWKLFVVGYSAACLLIRNDRYFLFSVAGHSIVQRKFNEAFDEYRIPGKSYSSVFSAYVKRRDALKIYTAMLMAQRNRCHLLALTNDSDVGELARRIPEFETWLDPSRRNYVRWLVSYLSHKWRRRGVVSISRSFARIVERFGRAASEMRLPVEKRVNAFVREDIAKHLLPGDVFITRHKAATTNLFLPGFWPHAALYIGNENDRERMGIGIDEHMRQRWSGDACVLEALKDGVRFRALQETLAVDYVAVFRPLISSEQLASGIERVIRHEGKHYNFDFDFFSSDRLVCSEVVYRAFDGLGTVDFPLTERAGRKTLSAEDLLHYALHSDAWQTVGVFGLAEAAQQFISDERAHRILLESYSPVGSGSSQSSQHR